MFIEREYALDKIAKESNRHGLAAVRIDRATPGEPLLVATDGSILVAIKAGNLTGTDTAEYLAPAVFALVRQSTSAYNPVADVHANGTATVNGDKMKGASVPTPELRASDFPDWRQVMPHADRKTVRFAIDLALLARLVAAIGSPEGIILTVAVNENGAATLDPIMVRPENDSNVHTAIIMPRRMD